VNARACGLIATANERRRFFLTKEGLNKLIKASGFGIGPSPIAKNTEIGHIPPI
jgi:hypothetical protein